MPHSWTPLYEDLATRLVAWEDRQPELLAFLRKLKEEGLPVVKLDDKGPAGEVPLAAIDPFTFFACFNRNVTQDNRLAVLARVRELLGSTAPMPTDFDGVPLADNQQSWFFPWAKERPADDIPALWRLLAQAVKGRAAVEAATFERCLGIKSVKIAKLTMGLFWVRPRAFMPLDGRSQAHLRRHAVSVPSVVSTWAQYVTVLAATEAALGSDFPQISHDAYKGQSEGRRYWAGGHQFGEGSKLDEFLSQRTWYIGHAKDADNKGAKAAWKRFPSIQPGDWLAIKGLGGQNYTLKIHAVGEVDSVDHEKGRLTWSPVEGVKLFHAKPPAAPGGGTWYETLCEVTDAACRAAVFGVGTSTGTGTAGGKKDPPPVARPSHPLNLILHGPPGTGKTWRMRRMREDFALLAKAPVPKPAVDVGDLTWFEVVALALHELGKPSTTPEIVAHPLVQAKYVERAPATRLSPYVWNQLQTHTVKDSKTVKYEARTGLLVFDRAEDGRWYLPKGLPDELKAKAGTAEANVPAADMADNQFFVTFHPSFTYEDFVEGIRPESAEDGATVQYPLRAGVFKQACERAVQLAGFTGGLDAFCALARGERAKALAEAPPAVVFIDEINRGNVARVFGELITLIEPDKRLGSTEELIVTLPGSRHRFGVPSNLWIVGTMNTADRSVVALDVALRRRFAFEERAPDAGVLDGVAVGDLAVGELLTAINARLEVLRDRDHLVGHAFFCPMLDPARRTLEELRRVFAESILPLLLEYFHDDLGRVGLVLGERFVAQRKGPAVFAKFEHEHREDLAERPAWTLADVRSLDLDAFRSILA